MAPHWVTTVAEARAAVDEEAAKKVDIIKFWVDDRMGAVTKLTPDIDTAIIDKADLVIVHWESAVALEYQGKTLKSISLQPIVLNVLGEGRPDVQDPRATNPLLFTRGLPSPAVGRARRFAVSLIKPRADTLSTDYHLASESRSGRNAVSSPMSGRYAHRR
jgi:hypothetical protein